MTGDPTNGLGLCGFVSRRLGASAVVRCTLRCENVKPMRGAEVVLFDP